ncbi:MAG TPA: Rieske (2Fe-2S) protein [Solirubrobacteraceae bacterium]
MRVVVAPVNEFPPGGRRIVQAGSRSIGVFRVGDRFYGIRNRCPHQGGPLCRGHLLDDAVADAPGRPRISENPTRIACPWHGWEYDLETGQSFMGARQAGVRSYGVAVQAGGPLLAEIEAAQAEAGEAELRRGPYVAETFQVHVQDDYVVLEV